MFTTEELADVDLRLKDAIDETLKNCNCKAEDQKWVNQMLIVRKGISLDVQFSDNTGAMEKFALLKTLLDSGSINCNC